MHDAQSAVAVLHRIHQHANGQQVINFIQLLMIPHHLFIDAVEILGTALNLTLDADSVQLLSQGLHGIVDHVLPFFPFRLDLFHQIVIQFRVTITKGHVLQFPFNGIDTQPVGQRRVDFQGLLGDGLLLMNRHVFHGPHIVESVRQLDDNYTDILSHGQEHLTIVFNLTFFLGNIFDFAQLGHSVNQHGHLRPKHFLQLLKSGIRILHHIVQKSGSQRFLVHLHLGQDVGYLGGMYDVGLAGTPFLVRMLLGGKFICFLNESNLLFVKIRR